MLKIDCARTSWMVVREIAHSLGLVYEHQRMDRDTYITITRLLVNLEFGESYEKFSESNPGFPYDYSSIMHPGPYYRHNRRYDEYGKKPVMSSWNTNYLYSLGSARIQANDINGINERYQCLSKCTNFPKPACKNDGQQNPNDCTGCVCPPMFTGKLCGQKHPGIQPFNGVSCGETIIKSDSNMNMEITLHYYYQSVQIEKRLRICESGVQIYFGGRFTNNAMTICDQEHLVPPRNVVQSSSKVMVRMYRSDLRDVGSVDTVLGFSYWQIVPK